MFCDDSREVARMIRLTASAAMALFLVSCSFGLRATAEGQERLNVLLITADDLNYDSLGLTGCQVEDITPNIDRLASQGLLFQRAHVNIAVCQPCRQVLMTGRYPHRNGGIGFNPINDDVPTLQESLHEAGYLLGIMAKVNHLQPIRKYCWDVVVQPSVLHEGRDPREYHEHAQRFFERAKEENRPFFLMANAQDPHRPFAESDQEGRRNFPAVSRSYRPDEVDVPGFLPDLPEVRQEMAEYYTSVHRCDEVVGAVLKALEESGQADRTLVLFLSDHGMALPFAKTNCWRHSTRTPWIVRWPGVVDPGSIDGEHFISGIDFMPSILEALGIDTIDGMDGSSFVDLLKGEAQEGRDQVFTEFHQTAGKRDYPMRCVHEGDLSYIYNGWSDGEFVFRNESQGGRTMRAMRAAAETDEEIAQRVQLFLYRVPEELYDYHADPDALDNLIDNPAHQNALTRLRQLLLDNMRDTDDPLTQQFERFLLGH